MTPITITPGRVATLHYRLCDADGRILDDSRARQQPLSYLHGHGNLFAALEAHLADAAPGAQMRVTLSPAQSYGERDEALVSETARSAFPADQPLQAGARFQAQGPEGPHTVTVIAARADSVTVDANHPLAGQTLSYEIEILEVREATRAERVKGHPLPPGTSHTEVEDRKQV